ncbi:hypothetical protein NHX12_002438 [Muraenolepis orangiensis]|uniref:Uncharacterized protein n=1 Tax=Muraenolepis orangiensis TaxID=630683 RepID=A0A9Q0DUG4_9TELE|nr:hypothetical protein NHX12_002438 [Muraenolepis orangiensis]
MVLWESRALGGRRPPGHHARHQRQSHVAPASTTPLTFRCLGAHQSLSISSQDLSHYLCNVIWDTEQPSGGSWAPPTIKM